MSFNKPSIRPHTGRFADSDRPFNLAGADSAHRLNDGKDVLAYTSPPQAARVQAVTLPIQKQRVASAGISNIRERIWLLTSLVITALYCVLLGAMLYLATGDVHLGIVAKLNDDKQWVVSRVVPTSLGHDQNVRQGDVVIEVDKQTLSGNPINGATESSFAGAKHLLIERKGQASIGHVEVKWSSDDTANSIRTWAYTILGLIFISVGGLVYAKARQRTAASAFYVFCIATASALAIALAAILGNEWMLAALFPVMVLWAGSCAVFFFKFPVRRSEERRVGKERRWRGTMVR